MNTIEERNKLRKELEEKLREVPKGERIHIDKEELDSLIFEQYLIEGENISCKIPVWTGDFLTKLDLSELEFENVSWSIHEGNPMFDSLSYEETQKFNMSASSKIDFSNTNARIDLSQSVEAKYYNNLYLVGCNFENVDLSFNDLSHVSDSAIFNCNLKNTGLLFPSHLIPYVTEPTVLEGCNLSNLNVSMFHFLTTLEGLDSNLKNTGLRIEYSGSYEEWSAIENYRGETSKEELAASLVSGRLDGCYINNIQIDSTQIQNPLQYVDQLAAAYSSGDAPKGSSHK